MQTTPAEIARRALADHLAALTAADLLTRYAVRRDPEAFAGLVQQFGPMVYGVCRRVLGASADVDDAFQAVFLSLARQAGSFRDAQALPAWLHRVALRVAHKALARRAPAGAAPEAVPDSADPFADVAWKDVRRVLDEELDRLPTQYRNPVVLCWLDGLTQDEAARRVGVSLATLKRRLEAGRELLRSRLVRRGLAPVLAVAAVADPAGLRAVVPEALKVLAVELGVGGAVPPGVRGLEVLVSATGPTRRAVLAALLGAGAAATGGLAYALTRPPLPPNLAATPGPPPGPQPVEIAPAPRLVLGPLQFESLGQPLPLDSGLWPRSVVFSRDGRTVISDGKIAPRVWDVKTRKYRDYVPPGKSIDFNSWSDILVGPDGRSVVTGINNTVQFAIYDYVNQVCRYGALGDRMAEWELNAVALSPDGNILATSGGNPGLRLWDASRWWKSPDRVGVKEPGRPPDWTLRDPRVLADPHDIYSMAFSPDGSTLAAAGGGWVRLWDVKAGTQKWSRKTPLAIDSRYHRIAFGPDRRWVAMSDLNPEGKSAVEVWDLVADTERTLVPSDQHRRCFCLAFHPDCRTLLVGNDRAITQWDVVTGTNRGALTVHDPKKPYTGGEHVAALAFSPDGNTLAAVHGVEGGSVVRLWKVTRQE